MRFRKEMVVVALLCFGEHTTLASGFDGRYWAQDTDYLEEDIQEHDDLLDEPTETTPVSRKGHAQITMVPFGFAVYPIPSYGAQASYFFADHWGVEYAYNFGNADIFDRQVKIEESSLRMFHHLPYGLHASYGIGLRNVRSEPLPSADADEPSSVTQGIGTFAFGKSWLTDTMVFSLDIWGMSLPFRQIQIRGEDTRDSEDRSDETKDFAAMQHGRTHSFLRFRFGVEF